ncbi:MAG: amino-acid N-acetyltransferase [Candidatus Nanopelagicales bacterium]
MSVIIRPAETGDVRAIRALVDAFAGDGPRMLKKSMVTLYEDVQEFVVAVDGSAGRGGEVFGCGALHVLWEDLAEVRTVAVSPGTQRTGIGSAVLLALLDRARGLGVKRVFCLTFATDFFGRHGFVEIDGMPIDHAVYEQLLESYDEGVAEMLGLERAKPNTLGNQRMLLVL